MYYEHRVVFALKSCLLTGLLYSNYKDEDEEAILFCVNTNGTPLVDFKGTDGGYQDGFY